MDRANKQFNRIVSNLLVSNPQDSEINYLRIEEIGSYFSVRMGKFKTYADAKDAYKLIQPLFRDAILQEAPIINERIRRSFPDLLANGPSKPVPDQYSLSDEESTVEEGRSGSAIEEKEIDQKIEMAEAEDRISINIQDSDIKTILKALAIKKNLNIVVGKDVVGKISVHLNNLPVKQVLDAIINFNGFSYMSEGDIIFVTKADKGKDNALQGSEVMIFQLNYVDLAEVEKVIGKLVSESAKITIYKPEKTLIVEDVPRNLAQVRKVLDTLDVPPKQVLIETRIMEVHLNDDTSLGIDWNNTFKGFLNSSGNVITQGFTGVSQGFFFDIVNSDFELFLEALQAKTEVKTISSPKLLALDNKEAKIIIGGKLGYHVTTTVDNTVLQSVEFLETGTQLVLTPHIVDDDRVIMDIYPKISDGTIINGLPTETTTEVTTSVMAPDGGTIFIGGLIRDRKEDITNRVPGLGAIPIFGALFSKTTNITVRTEIIVLITPHIITASNKKILEMDTQKVKETREHLQRERSLKELLPGTK